MPLPLKLLGGPRDGGESEISIYTSDGTYPPTLRIPGRVFRNADRVFMRSEVYRHAGGIAYQYDRCIDEELKPTAEGKYST